MEQYKQEFIEFMVDSQVLKFGEFTLKSGRKSLPKLSKKSERLETSPRRKLLHFWACPSQDIADMKQDVQSRRLKS